MSRFRICENPFCGAATAEKDAERCACGAGLRDLANGDSPPPPEPEAGGESDPGDDEQASARGIDAYCLSWLTRLQPYWPIGAIIGPTGAGKSSLINLGLGWPALWGRSGSHTTRCPAILTHDYRRVLSCGNENLGMEYFCEPGGAMRTEMPTLRNIDERLRFISERRISDNLRDRFWRPFEREFEDWHRTGLTGDVYVRVRTPLPGIPVGAAIVDIPGFDGSPVGVDRERHRLEAELAEATDFWSEIADVALFVFEREGLSREGELERLAQRLKRGKPTAIFFNKMDRLDLYEHLSPGDRAGDLRKAWANYKERQARRLREAGLDGCRVFFGYSAFDASGKPPSGPLALEWSRETAMALAWVRQSLKRMRKAEKKRPLEAVGAARRQKLLGLAIGGPSEERKALRIRVRAHLGYWSTRFPEDLGWDADADPGLLDNWQAVARAADTLHSDVSRSREANLAEILRDPLRKMFMGVRAAGMRKGLFDDIDVKSSEFLQAKEAFAAMEISPWKWLITRGKSFGDLADDAARHARQTHDYLLAYIRKKLGRQPGWGDFAALEHFAPELLGPEVVVAFFKKQLPGFIFRSSDEGFMALVRQYLDIAKAEVGKGIAQAAVDAESLEIHNQDAADSLTIRDEARALLDEAEGLGAREVRELLARLGRHGLL